ncbi:MAG: Gfo/Idh/MocA family oxidoreductase [Magnetococcales bacterium]|nr:Gfo/Idh/MocA family oxidoreductase [Magnetococcales bacterium]
MSGTMETGLWQGRVAVLGLGSIGMRHSRNLKALGVVDLVGMDPDAGRRDRFVEEIGGRCYDRLDEACLAGVGLVVVASPNRFHLEQSLFCARQGCHQLIEKPLGTDLEAARRLEGEITSRGLFAHVGSNWKFHPALQTLHDLLGRGAVGRVTGMQVLTGQWLPDWHPWEDYRHGYSARADLQGGVVFDSHELDYVTWLLGPVKRLHGMVHHSGSLEISTEDVAVVALQVESGALATIHMDYIQREYRRRYHISGDQGTLEWDMRTGEVRLFDARERKESLFPVHEADLNLMYLRQTRHVLEAMACGGAPVTPVSHAVRVLECQLAVRNDSVMS